MAKQEWCYSFDNSVFKSGSFATRKLALEDARKEANALNKENDENIKHVYVAKCELTENSSLFPDSEIIIEHMQCQAEDVGGEYAESYPDVSDEAEKELTEQLHRLLSDWCSKHEVSPTFYTVFESKKVALTVLNVASDLKG